VAPTLKLNIYELPKNTPTPTEPHAPLSRLFLSRTIQGTSFPYPPAPVVLQPRVQRSALCLLQGYGSALPSRDAPRANWYLKLLSVRDKAEVCLGMKQQGTAEEV